MILEGRKTSVLYSKHFLRKLKVKIVRLYLSKGFKSLNHFLEKVKDFIVKQSFKYLTPVGKSETGL